MIPSSQPLREAARAFGAAAAVALAASALLQTLIQATGASGAVASTPWWATAHLPERSRWVVLALIAWIVAPLVPVAAPPRDAGRPPPSSDVWRDVGIAVAIGPVLWTLAGCVVTVVVFTLADRWTMEGQVFRSAGYYRSLIVAWAPWLVGGGAVLLWSRHVEEPG